MVYNTILFKLNMTDLEFKKSISPILRWVTNKLKDQLEQLDLINPVLCSALIRDYCMEQSSISFRDLLIEFVTEIMTNEKYYPLENIQIVDEYIKSKSLKTYQKCTDKFNSELLDGDLVNVQKAGIHKIYKKDDDQLYFNPYPNLFGEQLVKDYFATDIVKCDKDGNVLS